MKKAWGHIKLVLKFSFAFLIIGYMVYSGRLDLAIVRRGFSHSGLLALCCVCILCSTAAAFSRWRLLLLGQHLVFTPLEIVRYGMIGAFFNTTMPGAVSGDIIKAWYMVANHKQYDKAPVLTSILIDRVMGVCGLVVMSAVALFLNWQAVWAIPKLRDVALLVAALAFGMIFFFAYILLSMSGPLAFLRRKIEALRKYKVGALFLKFYDAWIYYRSCPGILFRALLLAVLTHLFVMAMVILCAQAVGETHLEIYQYFLLAPLGLLMTAVPIAPAGLGVGHVVFGALFALLGSSNGAEIFTLYVMVQICFSLLGVFFYLGGPKIKPQEAAVAI